MVNMIFDSLYSKLPKEWVTKFSERSSQFIDTLGKGVTSINPYFKNFNDAVDTGLGANKNALNEKKAALDFSSWQAFNDGIAGESILGEEAQKDFARNAASTPLNNIIDIDLTNIDANYLAEIAQSYSSEQQYHSFKLFKNEYKRLLPELAPDIDSIISDIEKAETIDEKNAINEFAFIFIHGAIGKSTGVFSPESTFMRADATTATHKNIMFHANVLAQTVDSIIANIKEKKEFERYTRSGEREEFVGTLLGIKKELFPHWLRERDNTLLNHIYETEPNIELKRSEFESAVPLGKFRSIFSTPDEIDTADQSANKNLDSAKSYIKKYEKELTQIENDIVDDNKFLTAQPSIQTPQKVFKIKKSLKRIYKGNSLDSITKEERIRYVANAGFLKRLGEYGNIDTVSNRVGTAYRFFKDHATNIENRTISASIPIENNIAKIVADVLLYDKNFTKDYVERQLMNYLTTGDGTYIAGNEFKENIHLINEIRGIFNEEATNYERIFGAKDIGDIYGGGRLSGHLHIPGIIKAIQDNSITSVAAQLFNLLDVKKTAENLGITSGEITQDSVLRALRNTLEKYAVGDLINENPLTRDYVYKSLYDFYLFNKQLGDPRDLPEYFRSSISTTIKRNYIQENLITITDTGDRFTELDLYNAVVPQGISDENFIKNRTLRVLNSFVNMIGGYLFNANSDPVLKATSVPLDTLRRMSMISSLGGLQTTILGSDYAKIAIMTNKGVVNRLMDWVSSISQAFQEIPYKDLVALDIALEDMFPRFGHASETGRKLDDTFHLLTRSQQLTNNASYRFKRVLIHDVAEYVINKEEKSDRLKRIMDIYNISSKDLSYLEPYILLDENDRYTFSPSNIRNANRPALNKLLNAINAEVDIVVPKYGVLSKALYHQLDNSPYSQFVSTIFRMLYMFKGSQTDAATANIISTFAGNDLNLHEQAGYYGKFYLASFQQALFEKTLKAFLAGRSPLLPSSNDDVGKYLQRLYAFVLDSAVNVGHFGIFGEWLNGLLLGKDPDNLLNFRIFGSAVPIFKSLHGVGLVATGDVGKGMVEILKGANTINPIRNYPFVGLLFDRLVMDGFKELLLENPNRSFDATDRYYRDRGEVSFLPRLYGR